MRVWLITGAAGGLGGAFARAALDTGDQVVATARDAAALGSLEARGALTLSHDVTDRAAAFTTVDRALDRFGRIDVAVNNAGYAIHGAIEELTEAEMRAQLETNFFGALWVCQAVLPAMRARRSGRILNISSAAGGVGFPMVGAYSASKFALEGMSECLALECAPFGISVTIVAPSDFRTGFRDACRKRSHPLEAYEEAFAANLEALSGAHSGEESGDPDRAAAAVLEMLGREPAPLRQLLGNMAFERLDAHHRRQLEEWAAYESLARSADG
jgi:NAD(P)-dependent dehydrogenase (short-subunit alcohol dehydrogenase family)